MKLVLQFMKPHWKLCVSTILLLVIDVAGALFIPTLAAQMLNQGTSGASFEALLQTGIWMAVASVISGVCAILGGYACATLSARVGKDMRVAIYEKSLQLSIHDFNRFGTSSITTRTVSDITTIQFALTNAFQMVMPGACYYHSFSCSLFYFGYTDGIYSCWALLSLYFFLRF